jgi:hypothetical protein
MKKTILLTLIVAAQFACKKDKKEEDPAPVPTPAPQFSVKINGSDFSCNSCGSTYYSGGLWGATFGTSASENFLVNFSSTPKVGTYTLIKQGNPSMTYAKNNVYYHLANGTLNITAMDTSSNHSIRKLVATFSGVTDSLTTPVYTLTEGSINLNP